MSRKPSIGQVGAAALTLSAPDSPFDLSPGYSGVTGFSWSTSGKQGAAGWRATSRGKVKHCRASNAVVGRPRCAEVKSTGSGSYGPKKERENILTFHNHQTLFIGGGDLNLG